MALLAVTNKHADETFIYLLLSMHINPLNATNSRHMDLLLTCSPNNMDLLTIERPHRLKWTRNYRPLWQICGPAHQHTFIDMLTNTHTLTYTHIDMLTSTHLDMLTNNTCTCSQTQNCLPRDVQT